MNPPKKAPVKKAATTALAKKTVSTKVAKKVNKKSEGLMAVIQASILKDTGEKPVKASYNTPTPHVPSGNLFLDHTIGGSLTLDGKHRVCPGYPRRRVTEIFGDAGSGKTTTALQAVAEVQRLGGTAMFLDFEQAIDHKYAKAIGVKFDQSKLLLYGPRTLEEGFKMMFFGIMGGVDLIVIDSVAAMTPKKELERDIDDEDLVGIQAKRISTLMKRVINSWLHDPAAVKRNAEGTAILCINQERSAIGGMGSSKNTAGGKALKYYASVRMNLYKKSVEYVEKTDPLTGKKKKFPFGTHTVCKMVKNKMDSRQGQEAELFIRYGHGIDEHYSVIAAATSHGIVKKKTGGIFDYGQTSIRGREKFRLWLKEHPQTFQKIKEDVLKALDAAVREVDSVDEDEDEDDLTLMAVKEFGEEDSGDYSDTAEEEREPEQEVTLDPEEIGPEEPEDDAPGTIEPPKDVSETSGGLNDD
jgi:recombination protein RecA